MEKPVPISFATILALLLTGLFLGGLVSFFPIWAGVAILVAVANIFIFEKYQLGILAVTFFLPFQRLLTTEIGGYTLQISHFLIIITFFSWVIYLFIRREAKLAKTALDAPLAIFVLVNLLSMVNAINIWRSLAIFGWALISVLFYYLLANLVRDEEILTKVIRVFIFSGIIVSTFGIYQFVASYLGWPSFLGEYYLPHIGYITRIHSTTLEPLIFASYLIVVIPVMFSLYRMSNPPIKHSTLLVGLVLAFSALILTISRGGYAAAIIAIATILLLSRRQLEKKVRHTRMIGMIIVVALIVIFLTFIVAPKGSITMTLYQGARSRTMSIAERMIAFERAINFFKVSPLLGIGIGNFGPYSNFKLKRSITEVKSFEVVNNVPIEVLAETGILGFLALLWIGFQYLKSVWQVIVRPENELLRALLLGFTASFVGLSFQYLTFSPFYATWTWFMLGMSMAVVNLAKRGGAEKDEG